MSYQLGPLGALAGEWEGEHGFDSAYSHSTREAVITPYRERVTLTPFAPVRNGSQQLYGLDYRTAMWRGNETVPFHAEVGYWLWDGATGEIVRAFVVPRGITVLAGGTANSEAATFTLSALKGEGDYTIAENEYLSRRASTLSYRVTVDVDADGTWSYHEVTMLKFSERDEPFTHADRNILHRASRR